MSLGHSSAARALVIGGGVVGLASAIALQRRGFETVLIERAACPRGASWGNAGHMARATVRLAAGDTVDGTIAVVAGGAASAPLLRPHGHRIPLIAERGYH